MSPLKVLVKKQILHPLHLGARCETIYPVPREGAALAVADPQASRTQGLAVGDNAAFQASTLYFDAIAHRKFLPRIEAHIHQFPSGAAEDRADGDALVLGEPRAHEPFPRIAAQIPRGKPAPIVDLEQVPHVPGIDGVGAIAAVEVQVFPVQAGDDRHIGGGFHPALDLQGGHAGLCESREVRQQAQVSGAERIRGTGGSSGVRIGPFGYLIFGLIPVGQAAGLCAGPAVAGASADESAQLALPAVAQAEGAVREDLRFSRRAARCHALNLPQRHLTGQHDSLVS